MKKGVAVLIVEQSSEYDKNNDFISRLVAVEGNGLN